MPQYVDTIICEMSRSETNNKISLIGIFGDGMLAAQVPVVLPAFSVFQRWRTIEGETPGERILMSMLLRGHGVNVNVLPPTEVIVPKLPNRLVQLALQLYNLQLPEVGDYEIVTLVNNQESSRFVFYVALPK